VLCRLGGVQLGRLILGRGLLGWVRGGEGRKGKGRCTVVQYSKPNFKPTFLKFELDILPEIEHDCGENNKVATPYTHLVISIHPHLIIARETHYE